MGHWEPGKTIQKGRYIIAKILGYGGAGVTYRAQERPEKQWVAIKTLNALMQTRRDFAKHQERFIQEAFRLAKCSHHHVIRVDNICQEDSLWCMVMEYVAGGNLHQQAKIHKGLSEVEALRYIEQIGSALDYVHHQGFLHRDVKPANIMIRSHTQEAVLIDFGLAREFVQDEVQVHTNSRTESFAPLEQYEKRAKRGAYTDVYALAATLYYALTLQLPFPAPFRKQGAALIPPQQHNPRISNRVNQAILQGMELAPGDRPDSIPAWLALLQPASLSVPPLTPVVETPRGDRPAAPPSQSLKSRILRPPPPVRDEPLDPINTSAPTRGPESTPPSPSPPPSKATLAQSLTRQKAAETVHPVNLVNLHSTTEINFNLLQTCLAEAKFKEADQETAKILLKVTQRESRGWLDRPQVETLPCEALRTIDQLWSQGTNGRFGFSVQKNLYWELQGSFDHDNENWRTFCTRVGWRKNNRMVNYKDITFTLWAPEGHLPMLGFQFWGFRPWFEVLCYRLDHCQI
ncbi:MAG: serine/threonine-protein kinase [Synechocystis sp.]